MCPKQPTCNMPLKENYLQIEVFFYIGEKGVSSTSFHLICHFKFVSYHFSSDHKINIKESIQKWNIPWPTFLLLETVPDDSHLLPHSDLKIGLPVFISTEKNSVRQAVFGSSLGIQCLGHCFPGRRPRFNPWWVKQRSCEATRCSQKRASNGLLLLVGEERNCKVR